MDCPRLCNMPNKEGLIPLTLWMLALSKHENVELVNKLISFLITKTRLDDWKDSANLTKSNIAKLVELKQRFEKPWPHYEEKTPSSIEEQKYI